MGKKLNVDFTYYNPINAQQAEFHSSQSRHKCLMGGYGSGKTYPAIHESLFHCYKNDNHEYLIARNTWDSLVENVERETIQIAEKAGAIKKWEKTRHDLTLHNNTTIRFRPLNMSRAQFKGLNICGFYIDDPDVHRHKETISFLYSRLRNSPNSDAIKFQTIITANYEGHNWLWQTYMRGREQGGDDTFSYWICPTESNPTLPENFVEDLAAIHSPSWIDRFVHCKLDSYSGLIYDEYQPKVHDADLRWCFKDKDLVKVMAVDVGITDPSVVLKLATDYKNLYIYDEWYHPNIRSNVLGEYLRNEYTKDNSFRATVIDPSSARKEMTSGSSVRDDIRREFGVSTVPGNNDIAYGIEVLKSLFTVRELKHTNHTHLYIDPMRCPHTVRELEIYSWKEPEMSEFDEMAFKEKPIDKDNHCCDALRYGAVYMKRYLRGIFNKERNLEKRWDTLWKERFDKLKMYKENPRMMGGFEDYETKKHVEIHRKARKSIKPTYQFGR